MAPLNRSEKLQRLVAVQRHLERMAEFDLAETARQRRELAETIDRVADAMGSAKPLHAMFSGHYASQLGRLAQKDSMLHGLQQVHESRVIKERAKGDRLAEHVKDARDQEERAAADEAVFDIIDQRLLLPPDPY